MSATTAEGGHWAGGQHYSYVLPATLWSCGVGIGSEHAMHRLRRVVAHAAPTALPLAASGAASAAAEEELERDHEFFVREGYLRLPDLVTGSVLERARAAFTASAAAARSDWEHGLERNGWGTGLAAHPSKAARRATSETWHAPGYFDTPRILEVDEVFLEIIEQPRLVNLAQRILQEDAIHLFQIQARTAPADAPIDKSKGYTSWHR